jgi:hypothetical protein
VDQNTKTPETIITRIFSFRKIRRIGQFGLELANPAKLVNPVVRYMAIGQLCELAISVLQLALAEQALLELPAPPPKPNAQEFPTSRKRKMTSFEAAIQKECDALVRRCKEAV